MTSEARPVVSVDGVITGVADARVPAMDHGFLFGDSIYEVVRTHQGRPVAFAQHLERLRNSAHQTYLQLPWTDAEISARWHRHQTASAHITAVRDSLHRASSWSIPCANSALSMWSA